MCRREDLVGLWAYQLPIESEGPLREGEMEELQDYRRKSGSVRIAGVIAFISTYPGNFLKSARCGMCVALWFRNNPAEPGFC
jgi:hypothetical protein